MAAALAEVGGVVAVALAGSHARGRARAGSDLDLGILYDESNPIDVERLRALCRDWDDGRAPTVSELYGWGPWVNGGAWLRIRGERVDLLYRSYERIQTVWDAASQGRFEHHYGQQAPFGFFGPTVLGEVQVCRPLRSRDARLDEWKRRVAVYPEALREAVTRDLLWQVEFNLQSFLPKFVAREDAFGAAGCLARATYHLCLVLFALNRVYPLNDKTALEEISEMRAAPDDFAGRVRGLLAEVGGDRTALESSASVMADLFHETVGLAGGLYPRA